MMKQILAMAALMLLTIGVRAQSNPSSSATQTVNLSLSNAISLSFVGSGSTGSDVTLAFTSVGDYANGVESADQQLVVQSNKNFNVTIKSSTQNFTYSGSASQAPVMPIASVLQMKVTNNNTGGSLSYQNYASIPSGTATIINWGSPGGNQTFSVKYKATPGFQYPAGTYTASVVYTATQP